jgi:hypothetical protein
MFFYDDLASFFLLDDFVQNIKQSIDLLSKFITDDYCRHLFIEKDLFLALTRKS